MRLPPLHRACRRALRPLAALLVVLAAVPAAADLDVVFVLDTTGSMGGEIHEVQQRVQELAVSLAAARDGQRIRYGFVAYRDRGDAYVTLPFDLTEDVDAAERFLASLRAGGGGDGPESVVAGIAGALRGMSWNRSDMVERQIYLIGDAPPHLDYAGQPAPEELIAEARSARIIINAIGCRSLSPSGVEFFRTLAYATEGRYQHIGRVERERAGALVDTLSRSAGAGTDVAAATGRELVATWLAHEDGDFSDILVRQGGPGGLSQSPGGAGLGPCTLEVRLPTGFALSAPPRVWVGGGRLQVELRLTDGPGGLERFVLPECPPQSTPIDVVFGGE